MRTQRHIIHKVIYVLFLSVGGVAAAAPEVVVPPTKNWDGVYSLFDEADANRENSESIVQYTIRIGDPEAAPLSGRASDPPSGADTVARSAAGRAKIEISGFRLDRTVFASTNEASGELVLYYQSATSDGARANDEVEFHPGDELVRLRATETPSKFIAVWKKLRPSSRRETASVRLLPST